MKINSYNNSPIERNNKVLYIMGAMFLGIMAVFMLWLFVDLAVWIWNFIKDYWHFIIIGIVFILFIKRWFKKREIVVQKPQEGVNYG